MSSVGAVGRGPPQLSGVRSQGPAKDYRGAEGVHGADGTGRQWSSAQALQTRLDVEPVLPVGGVHRDGHAVCRKGSSTTHSLSFQLQQTQSRFQASERTHAGPSTKSQAVRLQQLQMSPSGLKAGSHTVIPHTDTVAWSISGSEAWTARQQLWLAS